MPYRVYASLDQIQLDELPSEFAMRTNHRSGGNLICKYKDEFDLEVSERLKNIWTDLTSMLKPSGRAGISNISNWIQFPPS